MQARSMGVAALAGLALLITSCSAGDSSSEGPVEVTALLIGYPDEDGIDATTGLPRPGIANLEKAFNDAHDDIRLDIINIPWGEGSTGYAAKTEAMIQAAEACLYEMPGYADYGRRGFLVDLNTMIDADPDFENVWGEQLKAAETVDGELFYLPSNTGIRVINWDAKLFEEWGVEPLSKNPTPDEVLEKAAELTGVNPVTGEQNYGYWYQGKYAVWQFLAIAHAMGADWGRVNPDGTMEIDWNTPEYLEALEWFVDAAQYAPDGALSSDAMPEGFLTDQNVVAIIPEGEAGYFLQSFVAEPDLADRYRTSFNFKGDDGLGGLNSVTPVAMADECDHKEQAWEALKWLAGSDESQEYYYDSLGRLPATEDGAAALPEVAALTDGDVILEQSLTAEATYPWASQDPRWAMQTALEGALAGTLTPEQALEQAQAETELWLADQGLAP
ncbi:extracellular solute-binding protein [Microbacterium immunditiarum]|uniref:ABC-type glycerol-3-phosphate transport system substrate-binding protein n=1 Tax=Microbacterium immunditiarum TaxID=337480 RepID=A0A7Y9GM90_9MICO|nr:extracellular solute-binding protein [Microbacterium immunditiarum]NYE19034.1 ABC-type glycerol-3-phosphate transport system substrate-binding protein [Microbacterium immunditiarum]